MCYQLVARLEHLLERVKLREVNAFPCHSNSTALHFVSPVLVLLMPTSVGKNESPPQEYSQAFNNYSY